MVNLNMKMLFSESMTKKRLTIILTSFLLFTGLLAYVVYEGTKQSVTLTLNGEKTVVKTHANTVGDLMAEQQIELRDEDVIEPSLETVIKDDMSIVWKAAIPVELVLNDDSKEIWTTAQTVHEFLTAQKINVTEHDKLEPGLNASIEAHMEILVESAFQLTLNVGGEEKQVWTTSTTVADFLEQQEIALNELDRVEPELDTMVDVNSIVKITRVEKVTDVVEESVDYAVVTKNDSGLTKGKQKVISAGVKGKVAKHYEIILENGKEISRELVKTETLSESKDRVVAIGTKVATQPVASRGSGKVAKEFYVNSTAYTAYCNGCSGITSTGINLKANPNMKVIAVDPSVIPLGTKVYVEGYGYAIAGDTGSAIKGYKIDVFFPTKSEAYRWGRKKVKIKILE
ncbi:ubiquitin-like domain-containing protein [Bacillus salitolerans]|uniref:Ubiquitin-like domain-containing protein n=1 Tax=Bacillus salitolerans TaxID=1437434 RepID=A0ABW4LNZ4_9BACI